MQDLRDERQLRLAAENRAAAETDKARIWQQRAEERAARISELTASGSGIRRLLGRKPSHPNQPLTSASPLERQRPTARPFAGVRLACAVPDDEMRSLKASFDAVELGNAPDADVVVIHPSRWAQAQGVLDEPTLAPVVVWGDDAPADLRAIASAVFDRHNPLPHTFDIGRPQSGAGVAISVASDEILRPTPDLIRAAADGTAVWVGANPDESLALAAAHASLRWVYRNYHPRQFGIRLLNDIGPAYRDPLPRLAMILATKRPHRVAQAIRQIGNQTYPNLELRVGLHGFEATDEIEQALSDTEIPAELLAFDDELPLGRVLNDLIDTTNAPLLAKIDDDDFYGPAHIEDSVNALEYSGCRVVGKATQFVYLEDENATILRRPNQEGVEIKGTLNGPTLVFGREVWEQGPFPNRPRFVDVLFGRAARANGHVLYATPRWEFCLIRNTASDHTYTGSSSAFLAGSDALWPGLDTSRCVVPDNLTGLYGS